MLQHPLGIVGAEEQDCLDTGEDASDAHDADDAQQAGADRDVQHPEALVHEEAELQVGRKRGQHRGQKE
jgi:hypothetical protein